MAPALVLAVILILALGIGGTGYAYLVRSRCGGELDLTVLSSPDQTPTLTSLAQRWSDSKPGVHGRCVRVTVVTKDSAAVVDSLSPSWDPRRDGDRPDVWTPEASTWVRLARLRAEASALVPAKTPALARTPIVIAMPRPMAEAIGWPDRQLGWLDLVRRLKDPEAWLRSGHPEWGRMRVGIADPSRDTAALSALLAIVNYDGDNELSADELRAGMDFERSVTTIAASTLALRQDLAKADAADRSLSYLSAFPATEWDVSQYNAGNPKVPLVAEYPPEGAPAADHPYVVLKAPWVDAPRRLAAAKFLAYLQGPAGRQAYIAQGFRSPSAAANGLITEQRGLLPAGGQDRAVRSSEVLLRVVAEWTAMRRRGNILVVVDASTSMGQSVDTGSHQTKLRIVQEATTQILGLLRPDSTIGLWSFSSAQAGRPGYQQLLPPGPVSRQGPEFDRALPNVRAGGGRELYEAAVAAYEKMLLSYQPGQLNLIFLITDGANDDRAGLSRERMLARLTAAHDPDRPVQFVSIGLGPAADTGTLRLMSAATGGRTYSCPNPDELVTVLMSALVGADARPR